MHGSATKILDKQRLHHTYKKHTKDNSSQKIQPQKSHPEANGFSGEIFSLRLLGEMFGMFFGVCEIANFQALPHSYITLQGSVYASQS